MIPRHTEKEKGISRELKKIPRGHLIGGQCEAALINRIWNHLNFFVRNTDFFELLRHVPGERDETTSAGNPVANEPVHVRMGFYPGDRLNIITYRADQARDTGV